MNCTLKQIKTENANKKNIYILEILEGLMKEKVKEEEGDKRTEKEKEREREDEG